MECRNLVTVYDLCSPIPYGMWEHYNGVPHMYDVGTF